MATNKAKTIIELSMDDLRTVVSDIMREERAKAIEESKRVNPIDIYTRGEVSKLLNVSFATLNRWEKIGYLIPVRFGRGVHYRKTDIQNLMGK